MPTSRVEPNRKSKKVTTKQTKKSKAMSETAQQVRQRPTWSPEEKLEITGIEFERIYNFFGNVSEASEALHSVLTRNILSGKIGFEFERQNADGQFEALPEEEAKPYQDQLKVAIEQAKAAQQPQPTAAPKPELHIVE